MQYSYNVEHMKNNCYVIYIRTSHPVLKVLAHDTLVMMTDTAVLVLRFLLLTFIYIQLSRINIIGVHYKSISAPTISFY